MEANNTRRGNTQEGVNVANQNKVILNLIQDLTAYINKVRSRIKYGMTPLYDNFLTARGFTLIELLVVVLIIGILAAVAMPQYQLAVKKSQFAKLRAMASSIAKTAHIDYLANGQWPTSFSQLDVEPSLKPTTHNCVQDNTNYCCLVVPLSGSSYGSVFCGQLDYSFTFQYRYASPSGNPMREYLCYEFQNKNFCQTLPGARLGLSRSWVMTPEGKIIQQEYVIN